MLRRPLALGILLLFSLSRLAAAERTDAVTLVNGDRVTGEVEKLERGRLQLRTDNMGTLLIEWQAVKSVSAKAQFDVETEDGAHRYGWLRPGKTGTDIEVVGDAGATALKRLAVVRIVPLRESFWRRLDGTLDIGFSYTQANRLTSLSLDLDARHRARKGQVQLIASSSTTAQEGAEDTSRQLLNLQYVRFLPSRWLYLSLGRLEQHRELGLDLRATAGVGFGRFFVQSNRQLLAASAGLTANQEVPHGSEPNEANLEAILVLQYSLFTYSFPNLRADAGLAIFPSLTVSGRVRTQLDVTLRRDVFRDFNTALTVSDSYDSRPPSEGSKRNDLSVGFSIGWRF
jgi:hypothetical protein